VGTYRFKAGRFEPLEKGVVTERPLTIMVNGQELATMMSTPVQLDCLVVGFLSFEGIIEDLSEIASLEIYEEMGLAEVTLTKPFTPPGPACLHLGVQRGDHLLVDAAAIPPDPYRRSAATGAGLSPHAAAL